MTAGPIAIADTGTTITAAFAAVAAVAAWATVATNWWHQRQARQPNVSAGFLDIMGTGRQRIEFVNMGPGLAIHLGYLLYVGGPGGQRFGGIVGSGHLQAGERAGVDVGIPVPGRTAEFVWVCRDIDQRLHVWSYAGKHRRLKKGWYPKLGDSFRLMYPDTPLPPRNVGVPEDAAAPGE